MPQRRSWPVRVAGVSLPAPTIRLRLTIVYGLVFLVTGAALLTIGYLLVRHDLYARQSFRDALRRAGIPPPPGGRFGGRGLLADPGSSARVAAAARDQLRQSTLHNLVIDYLAALGAMTLVSMGAGWLLAGRALAPLRRITATARRVSGENLGERIALSGPADELKELADTVDGMLARLDDAFAAQRRFVANASHELRTPLTIMRTEIDVALADPEAQEDDLRALADGLRETVDRCERLIEGLLTLARSQEAVRQPHPVDLVAVTSDCVTDFASRSRKEAIEVRTDLRPAQAFGNSALIERMVANLIDNAIRYNRPGGVLQVRTEQADGHVLLQVANEGAEIDPQDAETLTEPFRRLTHGGDGFGLGLSIVASVVKAHEGELALAPRQGGGLEITVRLPGGRPAPHDRHATTGHSATVGPSAPPGSPSPAGRRPFPTSANSAAEHHANWPSASRRRTPPQRPG